MEGVAGRGGAVGLAWHGPEGAAGPGPAPQRLARRRPEAGTAPAAPLAEKSRVSH